MSNKFLEEQFKNTFFEMWDTMCQPGEDTFSKLVSLIRSDFKGFGTSSIERYSSRESLFSFIKEQSRQAPDGFTYKVLWTDFKFLNDTVAEFQVEMSLRINTSKGAIPMDLLRISAIIENKDGKMQVSHSHASIPDQSVDDESFPGANEPRVYEEVSVLFTDFVGFTTMASTIPAKKLINELDDIFSSIDTIIDDNNLSKIKTIGDSYMAVGGLKSENHDDKNHAVEAVESAKQIIEYLAQRNSNSALKWNIRIGIHSGSVIGGVIGRKNLTFDLWGDTVNLASEIEQAGEANKINVSAYTYALIEKSIPCSYRGKVEIKGKRMLDMYFAD